MLRTREPEALIEQHPIIVDYGLSDRDAIAKSEYALVDPILALPGYGLADTFALGKIQMIAHLIRFVSRRFVWPDEATELIRKMGFRLGIPLELHAFTAEHPGKQIVHPIVVQDNSATKIAHSAHYQCAHCTRDWQRSLMLLPAIKFGGEYYRYLAFDRPWS